MLQCDGCCMNSAAILGRLPILGGAHNETVSSDEAFPRVPADRPVPCAADSHGSARTALAVSSGESPNMKWVAITGVTLVALAFNAFVRAYVICKIWGWYVVSAFSLPEISLSTAFGLSLLATLFVPPSIPRTSEGGKDWVELVGEIIGLFIGQLLGYGLVLILGGWVHDVATSP